MRHTSLSSTLSFSLTLGLTSLLSSCNTTPAHEQQVEADPFAGYLFVYFTGNDSTQEQIHFALSTDGFNYTALNNGQPVLSSTAISSTGGVRDPHILRNVDDTGFRMVATDMVSANGWNSNRAMVLLKSNNLTDWTHSVVNIQKRFEGQDSLLRVWAPQTIYDPEVGRYMIYWIMKYGSGPDIIYRAYANDEFTDLATEPEPLFIPQDGLSCIDGDIVVRDGVYHLFYKTEGHGNGIRCATTRSLTSGKWTEQPDYKQQTDKAVEGAGVFQLIGSDTYVLMYDVYMNGAYEFTESEDLVNFRLTKNKVTMNFHPRHGTVIQLRKSEMQRLEAKWPNLRAYQINKMKKKMANI